jgi:hypothetical protein
MYEHVSVLHCNVYFDSNVQMTNACAMFTKEDLKDRKFAFMHCWNILKDKPKWMTRRQDVGCAKKQATRNRRLRPILLQAQLQYLLFPLLLLLMKVNHL